MTAVNDGESELVDSFFGPEPVQAEPEPEPAPEAEPSYTISELEAMASEPDYDAEGYEPEIDPYSPNFEAQVANLTDEKIAEALQGYETDPEVVAWFENRQANQAARQEAERQQLWDENEALIEESIETNRRVHEAGRDTDIRAFLPAAAEAVYAELQNEGYSTDEALDLITNADKQTLVDLTTGAAAAAARDNEIKNYWLKRV